MDARERARLIAQYTPLVHRVVGIYAHAGFPPWVLDDLAQDGLVGLIKATDYFDPSKHPPFGSYSKRWISKYVRRGIARAVRERRERTWARGIPDTAPDPITAALADEVWRVIDTLEPLEQRVVVASFGLIRNGPKSYAAIAAAEDRTISQVRTILDTAKRKIVARLRL